jgi:hypothetical protein
MATKKSEGRQLKKGGERGQEKGEARQEQDEG